jgi:Raf kinase inhibitor-like YbhB/YbcL family protein
MIHPMILKSLLLAALVSLMAGAAHAAEVAKTALTLTSTSITDGTIPQRYACFEAGAGPALAWSVPPEGTRSIAVIARDLDSTLASLLGPFVHWVVYDIPPAVRELPDAVPPQPQLPNGIKQGTNGFDKVGFAGPCPPGSSAHRYEFTVFALDTTLDLANGATGKVLLAAIKGHILATGTLIGLYKR